MYQPGNDDPPVVPLAIAEAMQQLESENEDQEQQTNNTMKGPSTTEMDKKQQERSHCCCCWVCGVLIVIFVICICVAALRNPNKDSEIITTSAPSMAPPLMTTTTCQTKRVRITEICNIPDLDDDIFGTDTTMDIKVLINDVYTYWPKDVNKDCNPNYGSYHDTCVIPDSSLLMGCYPLDNSVVINIGNENDDDDGNNENLLLFSKDLKITVYDKDIFSDGEFVDFIVPKDQWIFPYDQCNEEGQGIQELEFPSTNGRSSIKMVVDPTGEELACGVDFDTLGDGLETTAQEMEALTTVLQQYISLDDDGGERHRKLFFGALIRGGITLVRGISKFGRIFSGSGGSKLQGILSTLADFTTIGGAIFSATTSDDDDGGGPSFDPQRQEELFNQVFEHFGHIDTQLDNIQEQLQEGFAGIELAIQEGFAKQELDKWIGIHLSILNDDYRSYLNPDHTPATRKVYETTFRESCLTDHSPYTTFKVLYSHSCHDCTLFDGQRSQQYILDTFVGLANANANFDGITERVLWFRKSYGIVIIAAMIETIYLHSVCLYQPETVCQNEDPIWSSRLEEMGQGLEEVAESLVAAEERLLE